MIELLVVIAIIALLLAMNAEIDIFASDVDNPVGYGDGHVEVTLKRQIKPRVRTTVGVYYY